MLHSFRILLLFAAMTLALGLPAHAQEKPTLSPQQIAAQVRPLHPKTLVFVFDVSASTRTGGVFRTERAATAAILRQGCDVGDRVILETFGTGFRTIFDKTLASSGDKDALIDQMPSGVEPGEGTNIRWPHAEALKAVAGDLPHPGVVVLLTDSYNDRPLTTDPNYPKYLDYYSLKGLTVYPGTSEDREYERLLRTLKGGGKLHQYGVGVGIAPSGRPIERLPVGPGQDDTSSAGTDTAPTVLTPTGQERPRNSLALPIGAAVLVLILIPLIYWFLSRPTPLRLRLGDRGTPRDYRLRHGARIALGGALSAASPGDEVFPLAGVSSPLAFLQGERGGARLIPAPDAGPDVPLFHNGLKLEQPAPARVGDEIRITLPATDTEPSREHRLRLEDPRAASF